MQATKARPVAARSGIIYLRTDEISPNPVQPRTVFDDEALRELSESIRSYGILNPLTVRRRSGRYELVAGERRLRAAKLVGMREVPCMLIDVNMEDAGLIALVENLQRRDLTVSPGLTFFLSGVIEIIDAVRRSVSKLMLTLTPKIFDSVFVLEQTRFNACMSSITATCPTSEGL